MVAFSSVLFASGQRLVEAGNVEHSTQNVTPPLDRSIVLRTIILAQVVIIKFMAAMLHDATSSGLDTRLRTSIQTTAADRQD